MEIVVKGTVFVEIGAKTMALLSGDAKVTDVLKSELSKIDTYTGLCDPHDKLEAITAEIRRLAKNGKGACVRLILNKYGAESASKLDPKSYDAFYDDIINII